MESVDVFLRSLLELSPIKSVVGAKRSVGVRDVGEVSVRSSVRMAKRVLHSSFGGTFFVGSLYKHSFWFIQLNEFRAKIFNLKVIINWKTVPD